MWSFSTCPIFIIESDMQRWLWRFEMMIAGIVLLGFGSLLRGWGGLNRTRSDVEKPLVFHSVFFELFILLLSLFLAILGSILIGVSSTFLWGVVAFVMYWFLSIIWWPVLRGLGL